MTSNIEILTVSVTPTMDGARAIPIVADSMAEQHNPPSAAEPSSATPPPPSPPPPPPFDPTRMVGIIKRKALIKDLAAVYHAECLAYCQELLELQRKWEWEEPPEDARKETVRPSKRTKKTR